MTPEQLIGFRVLASAITFLLVLGVAGLWWMVAEEVRRNGIGAFSVFMATATAAVTVALGALAYLATVI